MKTRRMGGGVAGAAVATFIEVAAQWGQTGAVHPREAMTAAAFGLLAGLLLAEVSRHVSGVAALTVLGTLFGFALYVWKTFVLFPYFGAQFSEDASRQVASPLARDVLFGLFVGFVLTAFEPKPSRLALSRDERRALRAR